MSERDGIRHGTLPQLCAVRTLTPAGPYESGDTLALAFLSPGVARVLAQGPRRVAATSDVPASPVPETLLAKVVHPAEPFAVDDRLVLSFVDPNVARLFHLVREAATPTAAPSSSRADDTVVSANVEGVSIVVNGRRNEPPAAPSRMTGPWLEMRWTPERVRRFTQVCGKLFTVDRLGWYRHSLALRLLLPDEIAGADASALAEAGERLRRLRSDATEALGAPLLAAFMPGFSVTSAWLDSLGNAQTREALEMFREAALVRVDDEADSAPDSDTIARTYLSEARLVEPRPPSLDAALALLIPTRSTNDLLTESLSVYRQELVDLFDQTCAAPEAVRLKTMSQPNHLLDERLWRLSGSVGQLFGPLAVA